MSGFIKLTAIITAIIGVALLAFVLDYYHSDKSSIENYVKEQNITRVQFKSNALLFYGSENKSALVFYPGAKVEYTAYEPLMSACAKRGIMGILIKMPLNFANFDINAAKRMKKYFPDIKNWYIGGHSLGGKYAAVHVYNYPNEYKGLILLGSYSSIKDLSKTDLKVLSIYGSEDKVLNLDNYNKYKSYLPKDTTEFVIQGGTHSYFGMYGYQKNDGTPNITNIEQIEFTADKIADFTK